MSKVKCIIEMDEDEYKRVKNAECSYDGFEKGTFGYYLNIIQKTATPITESDDVVSRAEVCSIANGLKDYCVSMYNPNDASEAEIINYIYKYVDALYDLPSVLPKREQGEWIGHREHCENLGVVPSGLGAYEWCSNCDCGIDVREWHRNHYNYCPNCGAEMR